MWFETHDQYTHPPESMIDPNWPIIPLSSQGKPCEKYGDGKWREPQFKPSIDPGLLKRFQYALHMMDTPLLCVDIDRHNNDGVATLADWRERFSAALPPTLATRSKSGRGYHLFYLKPDDLHRDVIGLSTRPGARPRESTGIDIRAWGLVAFCTRETERTIVATTNGLTPVECPVWLAYLIRQNTPPPSRPAPSNTTGISPFRSGCPRDCASPVTEGQRNNEIHRWGFGLSFSYVDWADHIRHRGRISGLDDREIERMITSIKQKRQI